MLPRKAKLQRQIRLIGLKNYSSLGVRDLQLLLSEATHNPLALFDTPHLSIRFLQRCAKKYGLKGYSKLTKPILKTELHQLLLDPAYIYLPRNFTWAGLKRYAIILGVKSTHCTTKSDIARVLNNTVKTETPFQIRQRGD